MRISADNFEIILNKIRGNYNEFRIANFAFDGLGVENIKQLLAALDNNTMVHTLDLSVNFLQPESTLFLASYINTNNSIERLELRGNHLGDDNTKLLLDALADNCGIKILDLKDNRLSDAIIPSIKQLLKHNTTLRLINLTFNNFSSNGIKELLKVVNIHCLLQLDSKDRAYLQAVKAAKFKIKLLFKLQIYIRYVLYDNIKYSGEAKNVKKTALWESIGNICWDVINKTCYPEEAIEFFIDLIKSSFETDNFYDPMMFIDSCLKRDGVTNTLLYAVITLPDSNSRNEILHTIGDSLFCSEKNCYKSMFNLVNAYICFLNISNRTLYQNRMLLESYRALVSALGIVDNSLELRIWKQKYQFNHQICDFENIIQEIDVMIKNQNKKLHTSPIFTQERSDDLLMILFAHRNKIKAQQEITQTRLRLYL